MYFVRRHELLRERCPRRHRLPFGERRARLPLRRYPPPLLLRLLRHGARALGRRLEAEDLLAGGLALLQQLFGLPTIGTREVFSNKLAKVSVLLI
jgi:hypothetical protein